MKWRLWTSQILISLRHILHKPRGQSGHVTYGAHSDKQNLYEYYPIYNLARRSYEVSMGGDRLGQCSTTESLNKCNMFAVFMGCFRYSNYYGGLQLSTL
jgi:hypothetical protein